LQGVLDGLPLVVVIEDHIYPFGLLRHSGHLINPLAQLLFAVKIVVTLPGFVVFEPFVIITAVEA